MNNDQDLSLFNFYWQGLENRLGKIDTEGKLNKAKEILQEQIDFNKADDHKMGTHHNDSFNEDLTHILYGLNGVCYFSKFDQPNLWKYANVKYKELVHSNG